MRIIVALLIAAVLEISTEPRLWFGSAEAAVAPMNDYCQIPPYVSNAGPTIKPNVLLIVDNSGSMFEFAYKSSGTGADQSTPDTSYDPGSTYVGYFDPERMYKYDGSGGHFEIDPNAAPNKDSFWSGNFLNWLTMRRIDVIRKVLIGGKAKTRSTNTANALVAANSPDRDFYKSYKGIGYKVAAGTSSETITVSADGTTYNVHVSLGNQPPSDGLIVQYSDRINFGVMFFNDGAKYEDSLHGIRDGGYLSAEIGSTMAKLIDDVEKADPSTSTPLGETLYEATRYFQAADSAYQGAPYSSKDPIEYPCQKNFVLILSDGEPTKDQNLPGSAFVLSGRVSDPNFNVKTWMDSIGAQEGYPSQYATALPKQGSYYLEGVAYWAHVTDLRSATLGKSDLPGKQNLTIYTVFAFDDSAVGRDVLQKAAKYGGFIDYDGTGRPDKTDKWDRDGDGVPDTFFTAQDGPRLMDSLEKAFNDILSRVASGTAASVLGNGDGNGSNLMQAVFFPKKFFDDDTSAEWIGEMYSMWFYLDPFASNASVREDTDYVTGSSDPPHYLNLSRDRVVTFVNGSQEKAEARRYNDLKGKGVPYVDSNGDGVADSYTYVDQVDADNVLSLWRAGRLLWSRSTPRTIYTQTSGSLTSFTGLSTSSSTNQKLLQAASQPEAAKIISYVGGTEQSGYRSRTVSIGGASGVWRLGDIVSSTPRLQSSFRLNSYSLPSPSGYNDKSYGDDARRTGFIYGSAYANRGMVYVGANDGMLHAFKLGTLNQTPTGDLKATLSGSGLGQESWAFIPKNALPYLRYLGDPNYNHLFFVDGTTVINDVSIGTTGGCKTTYWNCAKDTTGGSNWRTVLISSMGLGGASKPTGAGCKSTNCVETPIMDPSNTSKGLGYSSYFALDVTDPNAPSFLWEFAGPNLGFSTPGPAIVKIAAKKGDGVTADPSKNGYWFVVLASGPTGPIDPTSHQFQGTSSQNLTIYVLNLTDGTVAATIDTLVDGTKLANAFAGSITNAVVDVDRWSPGLPGNYQDDALYIGYTQLSGTVWTGGVLRLLTGENPDPTTWRLSKVIDGVGPVTANIARLQDRATHSLWLYFGTGRQYYHLDDPSSQRLIAGIKEPCYTQTDSLDRLCTSKLALSDLTLQDSIQAVGNKGWYIRLDQQDSSFGAERVVTDPVALVNGAVYFTTFKPTADICGFGGNSYLWGVKYDSGEAPNAASKQGKALIQVSNGSIQELDLSRAFTDKSFRRTALPIVGKPSSEAPPIITKAGNRPLKKVLHIRER